MGARYSVPETPPQSQQMSAPPAHACGIAREAIKKCISVKSIDWDMRGTIHAEELVGQNWVMMRLEPNFEINVYLDFKRTDGTEHVGRGSAGAVVIKHIRKGNCDISVKVTRRQPDRNLFVSRIANGQITETVGTARALHAKEKELQRCIRHVFQSILGVSRSAVRNSSVQNTSSSRRFT